MRFTEEHILEAIQNLVGSADNTGCSEDVTVVSQAAVDRLEQVLKFARENNRKARDVKYLVTTALETQNAANPRPLAVLFDNAVHTVMADGGNPSYEHSPLCRLILNTLLNLMRYRSLPHYNEDGLLYGKDVEQLEALVATGKAA